MPLLSRTNLAAVLNGSLIYTTAGFSDESHHLTPADLHGLSSSYPAFSYGAPHCAVAGLRLSVLYPYILSL